MSDEKMFDEKKYIPMEIKGLMMDPRSNVPIVVLRNEEKSKILPIWIGLFEANAIALQLDGFEPPRPMTHDLMLNLIEELGATVVRISITGLEENTFFARIHLALANNEELSVDSRPSDAIALALRAEAPLLISDNVLEQALNDESEEELSDDEKLKKWLEEINPEDLGKYTM